ncbi:MAG: chemotaxis protein CheW [Sulfuritalea sp.]|nr:chemotaxis protein CheW [Sulfuritalea sp.]
MAKRISLREFQQGLSERLLSARRGEGAQALLGIESGADDLPGGSHWLIDLADSGEVSPLPQLTPAPLTKPWFAGIANIRGVLYSVVDFSAWRGGAPTPINAQSRLLLVGARHGINSALLVRRALGLRPHHGWVVALRTHKTSFGPSCASLRCWPTRTTSTSLFERSGKDYPWPSSCPSRCQTLTDAPGMRPRREPLQRLPQKTVAAKACR